MTDSKTENVTLYANALLSDGEILFYYTGGDKCNDYNEFYKDFYFAGINMLEYAKSHELKVEVMEITISEEYNNYVFENIAKEFYRLFSISKDSRGGKPY